MGGERLGLRLVAFGGGSVSGGWCGVVFLDGSSNGERRILGCPEEALAVGVGKCGGGGVWFGACGTTVAGGLGET